MGQICFSSQMVDCTSRFSGHYSINYMVGRQALTTDKMKPRTKGGHESCTVRIVMIKKPYVKYLGY